VTSGCSVPLSRQHRRLVSLWDIMKRIYPPLFLSLGKLLEVSSFRIRLPFKDIFTPPGQPKELLDVEFKHAVATVLDEWETECRDLELAASLATVQRLRKLISEPTCEYREYAELAQQLHGRLEDEMKHRYCLALSMKEGETYDRPLKGWERIAERFQDCLSDIEEMNKCFALSRYTAAMFHALHVAEWGAVELGKYIGVTDPKPGWGPTVRKLNELVKNGHTALPIALSGKFEFLEQIQREIETMVLAWRHKVDHATNRLAIVPNVEFTPDIAEHIMQSVRVFMNRLVEEV
jgi:hypothetical protein